MSAKMTLRLLPGGTREIEVENDSVEAIVAGARKAGIDLNGFTVEVDGDQAVAAAEVKGA